ncbi:MAG: hypothetical protein LBS74_07975 [Oscillospiraceae bacterium]|jgi:hypothetical protein|nr:hypothetical protein [Oscillospiraceae bacterium]
MENIKFENVYEITPKLLKSWRSPLQRSIRRNQYILPWLCFFALQVYFILRDILEGDGLNVADIVGACVVLALVLCIQFVLYNIKIKKHFKTHQVEKWYYTIPRNIRELQHQAELVEVLSYYTISKLKLQVPVTRIFQQI